MNLADRDLFQLGPLSKVGLAGPCIARGIFAPVSRGHVPPLRPIDRAGPLTMRRV